MQPPVSFRTYMYVYTCTCTQLTVYVHSTVILGDYPLHTCTCTCMFTQCVYVCRTCVSSYYDSMPVEMVVQYIAEENYVHVCKLPCVEFNPLTLFINLADLQHIFIAYDDESIYTYVYFTDTVRGECTLYVHVCVYCVCIPLTECANVAAKMLKCTCDLELVFSALYWHALYIYCQTRLILISTIYIKTTVTHKIHKHSYVGASYTS